MHVILSGTFGHMIIMTRKMDPQGERGARISIKESSIKVTNIKTQEKLD
jgi:hypothetical protein